MKRKRVKYRNQTPILTFQVMGLLILQRISVNTMNEAFISPHEPTKLKMGGPSSWRIFLLLGLLHHATAWWSMVWFHFKKIFWGLVNWFHSFWIVGQELKMFVFVTNWEYSFFNLARLSYKYNCWWCFKRLKRFNVNEINKSWLSMELKDLDMKLI